VLLLPANSEFRGRRDIFAFVTQMPAATSTSAMTTAR
jgi:hypothetical protein